MFRKIAAVLALVFIVAVGSYYMFSPYQEWMRIIFGLGYYDRGIEW
jgi:hypothetical protein